MYIDTNEIPSIKNPDQATRNRFVIIPCDHIVTRNQDMDVNLLDKMIDEREGIIAWLVDGCFKALQDGISPPQCVSDIQKNYWEKTDAYTAWLNDRDYVIADNEAVVTVSQAFESFERWCENNDIKSPSRNTFRKDMNEIVRYVDGIQITPVTKIKGTKAAGWSGIMMAKDNNQ